jgi:hypothetical protein
MSTDETNLVCQRTKRALGALKYKVPQKKKKKKKKKPWSNSTNFCKTHQSHFDLYLVMMAVWN